jgi:hypothetical protein
MNPYWLIVFFTVIAQLVVFLRWLHRRMRDDEIERAFVHDMATSHLPHMYHALRLIANHLDIELEDPPPVRFLELSGPTPPPARR